MDFSLNLLCALILWRSVLGLLMGIFFINFNRVVCTPHDSGRVLLFHVFIFV